MKVQATHCLGKLLAMATVVMLSLVPSVLSGSAATSGQRSGIDRCEWLDQSGKATPRFPVLPGGGWDNLRNREMGPVADLSMRDCVVSVDGLYVIPSQVVLYPVKESRVSLMSDVMEHYENYTSSTSRSVNGGAGGSFFDNMLGISGKYSEEFQQVKKTALYSRTQIGRTQQRYNMYVARLLPEFRLSESFKNRLLDIGSALGSNQTRHARYLSDMLVRDFGTHVVTSMDAGAVLEKVDFFKRDSLSTSVYTRNKISQCLSVDFMSIFSASASTSLDVSTEELKGYRKSIQKTSVNTHGGPAMGAKINLTSWERGLRNNLVAIDRVGDLLFMVITHRSLPELPKMHLKGVIDAVKEAISRYYKMNEVKGCLDPDSPNFEPLANVEGSCETPMTNFSFGGAFQTCQESHPGLCGQPHSPTQVNYVTGGFSCPAGYEPMLLISIVGISGKRFSFWRLESYWTVLNAYWCSAGRNSKLPTQSGALYGGAYSPRFDNPATGAKACGAYFRPYSVARDVKLCLSADMRDGLRTRVPLGGLFSCQAGNPLAEPDRPPVVAAGAPPPRPTPRPAPKRCPDGFSRAALDVIDGCELMQCFRMTRDQRRSRQGARRPPYEEPPGEWPVIVGDASSASASSSSFQLPRGDNHVIAWTIGGLSFVIVAVMLTVALAVRQTQRRRQWVNIGESSSPASTVAAAGAAEVSDRQPLLSTSGGGARDGSSSC